MKIQFMQTGGFAGLSKTLVLDSNDLAADEKEQLATLIKSAGPLPEAKKGDGKDVQSYEIDIDGEKTSLDDTTITSGLKDIFSFVQTKVMELKKKAKGV